MYLKSNRCHIRPFEEEDLKAFITYRNNLDWMKYQGFKGLSEEAYREILLVQQKLTEGAQLAITLSDTTQLIGDIYLKEEQDTIWIGYTIAPAYARQGYAGEVVQALCNHLMAEGYATVNAGAEPENTASIRLLEKLGFTFIEKDQHGELIYQLPLDK